MEYCAKLALAETSRAINWLTREEAPSVATFRLKIIPRIRASRGYIPDLMPLSQLIHYSCRVAKIQMIRVSCVFQIFSGVCGWVLMVHFLVNLVYSNAHKNQPASASICDKAIYLYHRKSFHNLNNDSICRRRNQIGHELRLQLLCFGPRKQSRRNDARILR